MSQKNEAIFPLTARVINIDPLVSGKHAGATRLIVMGRRRPTIGRPAPAPSTGSIVMNTAVRRHGFRRAHEIGN